MKNGPSWIEKAVFYEIYPQTFFDSNADGIGDLKGIESKLDYICSLGVTAIWLNPCFESPFQDAGYDISDFYKIAPRYGTNKDMKRLIDACHKRGLKMVFDLVAGHTSIEHPFFIDAQKRGHKSPYDHFYMFTENWSDLPKKHQEPFITGYGPRNGYYRINFFYAQPALNYGYAHPDPDCSWQLPTDHPDVLKVRQELKNVMKFWLDMGCDGFRVDMAPSLVKFDDENHSANQALWREYRKWFDENYPEAILIAEWSNPPQAIKAGFHTDFKIHDADYLGYTKLMRAEKFRVGQNDVTWGFRSFFDNCGLGDAKEFMDEVECQLKQINNEGYISFVTGNHDLGRIAAGRTQDELKIIYAFLMLLPGIPFIYYGDEIGMNNVEDLGNKEGSYDRSVARTPMQWTPNRQNAGWSEANPKEFYLPLDKKIGRPNVESQEKDPDSLLNFVRYLINLRQAQAAFAPDAEYNCLYCKKNQVPVIYERRSGNECFVVAVNPSGKPCEAVFALENADKFKFLKTQGKCKLLVSPGAAKLQMPASSYAILQQA